MLKRYIRLIDRVVYNFIEDFGSFRNKLVILTFLMVVAALYVSYRQESASVIAVVMGAWTLILGYYFKLRHESGLNGNAPKSIYDNEIKKDIKGGDTNGSD